MLDFRRTHTCEELRSAHVGNQVRLSGWVHNRRDLGGLIFITLRDRYGIVQLIFDPQKNPAVHTIAKTLRSEWVITAHGTVNARAEGMANSNMPTGEIEIEVTGLEILSKADTPPFSVCEEEIEVNEELRLKHRCLDIRRGDIAKKLVIRHKAMLSTRQYMDKHGFLEINTPILGRSTPEGARDYLVPSRIYPGQFYALPQSPQIFKQLLMVAGMDRYFQIAPCFRDEDLRADRQPEFSQIDVEMSFGTKEELFPLIEGLIAKMFQDSIGVALSTPFRRMPYKEAIDRYGTDKPDLRFGMELHKLDDIAKRSNFTVFQNQIEQGGTVKGLCVKNGSDISRKGIDNYTSFVGQLGIKGLAWIKIEDDGSLRSSITKFFSDELQNELKLRLSCTPGDLIFMIADEPGRTNQALDHLRRKLARDRNLIDENRYEFLWVEDFPLFTWNEEENRMETEHHPFTSPLFEDIPMLDSDPLHVRSSSYDLVVNGYETASGSQRIHDSHLQEKIFKTLKLSKEELQEKFGFFLDALNYGTPPHLGVALGFDRLLMVLSKTENIRDVIAFPKTTKASDLLMQSPSGVSSEQLKELGLKVINER